MLRGRTAPLVLALFLAIGLLTAAQAGAATYTVTTTQDISAASAGCNLSVCSLRQAVAAALDDNVADEIVVPAGTYTLSGGTGFGQLTLNDDAAGLTIRGAGAGQTIVSGGSSTFRVFNLVGPADVTVTGMTIRDGRATDGTAGANVLVGSGASLTLDHVRVTNGLGSRGAGIAALGADSVEIFRSLIDANSAIVQTNDGGGGLLVDGQTGGATDVLVQDSTFTSNLAVQAGAGILVRSNANAAVMLEGVTIARNQTGQNAGGGLFVLAQPSSPVRVGGSILAGNTGANGPANCGGAPLFNDGGNVDSGADCGLAAGGRQNTDPQLSPTLVDAGGQTPVLSLAATSPALDLGPCFTLTDQRDVARPQGSNCDAGAFELVVIPPVVDPPLVDPPQQPPPPRAAATPKPRKSVVLTATGGRVLVKLPGTKRFVPLTEVTELPVGTVVNATGGRIVVTAAADDKGATQTAVFYGGIFKIGQTGPPNRLTTILTLVGEKPRCPKAKPKRARSARKAKARRLWGDGKGRFQTKGQYSSATVRGTKWLVEDNCKGTLTKVARGSVTVRDFAKRKNVIVKAGKSYLARP